MKHLSSLALLSALLLAGPSPAAPGGGPGRNYSCSNCGTILTAGEKPRSNGCPTSRSHEWHKLGEAGDTWYSCRHSRHLVLSDGKPDEEGCTDGQDHQWHKLAGKGSKNYLCQSCGLSIAADGKPRADGCTVGEGEHQWNKQ